MQHTTYIHNIYVHNIHIHNIYTSHLRCCFIKPREFMLSTSKTKLPPESLTILRVITF